MLAKFLKAGFEFHRSGSCALCLANVANGKMDAYWEVFTKPWDALAGYLLVKEAGGQTNDFENNLFENQGIYCCGVARAFWKNRESLNQSAIFRARRTNYDLQSGHQLDLSWTARRARRE